MTLEPGGIYSFSVYPVAVLGTNFKNVLVMANLDGETARDLGLDLLSKHALISPSLPDTTQKKDPTKYRYIKIKYPSGNTDILAIEWINPDTITTVNLGRFTVVIDNESSSNQAKILACLASNGYTIKSIQFDSMVTVPT